MLKRALAHLLTPRVFSSNGGPGCSSLEGLFAELGQLLVVEDAPSTLEVNPFSWSNVR